MTEADKKYEFKIVDDDDFLVDMYATRFGGSDVSVEVCKSGTSLLEKLQTGAGADLILLDIVMPGMNGMEALKKMRHDKLGEGIPVVMLTNQSDEKDISEAKKLGIAGYIVKSAGSPTGEGKQGMNNNKKSHN